MTCATNLVQHQSDMYTIMYRIYTQNKCKVAVFTHQMSFLMFLSEYFLCALSGVQPNRSRVIQSYFSSGRFRPFVTLERDIRKSRTHTAKSRIKNQNRKNSRMPWFSDLKMLLMWCLFLFLSCAILPNKIQKEQTGHATGCPPKEEGPGSSMLNHAKMPEEKS